MAFADIAFLAELTALQYAVLGAIISVFVLALCRQGLKRKGALPLPPGPPGLPVIGNAPTIVRESIKGLQHQLMLSWAREYGEIFRVRIGPFEEYFINSDVAVKVSLRSYACAMG